MKKTKTIILITASALVLCASGYTLSNAIASYSQAQRNFQVLERHVYRMARGFRGQCAYIIKDVQKPALAISFAQHKPFPAASIIKLPIAAVAFKAIKEKRISADQRIVISDADITGGSGKLKTLETPITLTFQELIGTMISRSDNTATNKLINLLGYQYINKSFRELGLKRTVLRRKMMDFSGRRHGVENYTTASDICYLFEKIYADQLIDKASSELLMDFLKDQKVRDRIPKLLPKSVVVAHKTGLERGVVHDAGIIFSPKGNRLICVLTKKAKNTKNAKRFIARVALLTYTNISQE